MSEIRARLSRNLEAAAIYVKEKVKLAVNRSQPYERIVGENGVYYRGLDPSLPGEPPKKITGFLQRSIAHKMSGDKQHAFVGTGIDYGLYLEIGTVKMEARPFLRPTIDGNQDVIHRIITTGRAK